jgi:hypothetical protein
VAGALLASLVTTWVVGDLARRGRRVPYDADSFIYYAAMVAIPAYLLWTRRWRALLLAAVFLILAFAMDLLASLCVSLAAK